LNDKDDRFACGVPPQPKPDKLLNLGNRFPIREATGTLDARPLTKRMLPVVRAGAGVLSAPLGLMEWRDTGAPASIFGERFLQAVNESTATAKAPHN
jgi:hypothetical protein